MEMKYKRNFCIVAHIDHGKSTLSDRLIQKSKIIDERKMKNQILDNMDIERERGITIKSQAVTIPYKAKDGHDYELNFVDTPGHVDFSYEVSRAIASCEGALLLIDASQGVESQTVSNMYMALEQDLEIIPVINKIDLPSADIPAVRHQIDKELGLDDSITQLVSAKTGEGIDELFEAIVNDFPPPSGDASSPLQALIFDCHYDPYRGVIVHIRVKNGTVKTGDVIKMMSTSSEYKVEQAGIFKIDYEETGKLEAGDVGYLICGIKTVSDVKVGDTLTLQQNPAKEPLSGFKEVKPVVYSSIYPMDSNDYEELKESLEKLKLNDASLVYEKDNSNYTIPSVTGETKYLAIKKAIADLGEDYRENAHIIMTYADYLDIIEALANGNATLFMAQPEQILGKPVIFVDAATIPIVGDLSYLQINYHPETISDSDKNVKTGMNTFALTAWYDIQFRLRSAFRLAVTQ